jgi:uncharacterized protein (DUF2147 family)
MSGLGLNVGSVLAALLHVAPGHAAPDAPPAGISYGTWANPQGSVHVRAHSCGADLCGTVVWANEEAKKDARDGGTPQLIGVELFRDFERETETLWRGKVFVPDMGKTLSGTIDFVDDRTLQGRGCLFGRILCKTQIWTKVDVPNR